MNSKLSDFVRLSPLEAALAVLFNRFRLPARYLGPDGAEERIEPEIDESSPVAILIDDDTASLPYIADEDAAAADALPAMTAND